MKTRQNALALAVTAILPLIAAADANSATTTIAISGQSAPGPSGNVQIFADSSGPVINAVGQVAFYAGTTAASNNFGLYLGSGGPLSLVVHGGQAAPGGGVFFNLSPPSINDAGQVMFTGVHSGPSGVTDTLMLSSGGTRTRVAGSGDIAPGGGRLHNILSTALNAVGQITFIAGVSDAPNDFGMFLASGGTLSAIARQGQAAPGGGNFTLFGHPSLNDAGQVAFRAAQSDPTNPFGIYLAGAGTTNVIARQGQAAPGGGNFIDFDAPSLNASGQVTFWATQSEPTNNQGIYLGSNGVLSLIARTGQAAPGGGSFTQLSSLPTLNDAGQVAFIAALSDPTSVLGIYRGSGGALTLIARGGQAAPNGANGRISALGAPSSLLAGGAVLFNSTLTGTTGGTSDNFGLYLGDGIDTVEVMRTGRTLAGKTVSDVRTPFVRDTGGLAPANDLGQVAYYASFTDGGSGIFVFTPELQWRRALSGTWDTATNWTLGIGPDSVHDVKIAPAASVTVTGPVTNRTIRTLQVGGGTGTATLQLASGAVITATGGPIQILPGGVVTGDGTLATALNNTGTVVGQNLTFAAGWTNGGLVLGGTGLSRRIVGDLTNLAAGQVRIGASERLLLQGTSHANAGRIEVIGGQLEVAGTLANSGNVNLRDAIARFNGGLSNTNTGLVGVSFGTSDVFGTIVNQGSGPTNRGRIILSGGANVTFYDAVTNNGELRVSAGANAVFFGRVNGIGAFTGSGAKFFEGGFSPGLSPALIELDGPVTFGTSSLLTIELAGTRRILEPFTVVDDGYDRVKVNGLLELLSGPLEVVLLGSFSPGAGQSFDVLDWDELRGTFGTVALPGLANGLLWDTSRLYSDGTLSVAAVPEPHEYALMLTGLALVGAAVRRRRKSLHGTGGDANAVASSPRALPVARS